MMRLINNPSPADWERLSQRPSVEKERLDQTVSTIINQVRTNGDKALQDFALKFDQVTLENIKVTSAELEQAQKNVSGALKQAIRVAYNNIYKFHLAQKKNETQVETMEGVTCWRKEVAIENVGLYIPGGTAPLFSTILMLATPAQIAGCNRIVLCTPCDKNGTINPAVLYTAHFLGITEIYKIGGAQAIAALAYGTQTIKKVDKIFGPGNQYVTKAKELVQKDGIAIDLPAGPSEVLVIADQNANPEFVAADLLSQAEHGTDSQVVLVTTSPTLIEQVQTAITAQLAVLPRVEIAKKALTNSFTVLVKTIDQCIAFSNTYAPEHLILAVQNATSYCDQIINAGSVFLGNYSCESAGDYASGTNHTLPTNGYAKSYSGVSYDSFVKKITFQNITEKGIQNIGNTIEIMAEAEQLMAHKNAVTVRLNSLKNE